MSRVLITGGAGFMGFHLARSLVQEGCQVDLVDNLARGVKDQELTDLLSRPGVRFFPLNLLEPDATSALSLDYDYIYHLAAIVGVAHVLHRPFEVLRDNTLLLLAVVELARRQRRLQRFIFTSTSEVYAGTLRYFDLPVPTPETTPLAVTDLGEPRTSYMLSKIYGEALCRHAGVPVTIVRPHNVYGPRMGLSHVIPELLHKAVQAPEGGSLEVFSVDHRRTFCYIADAMELLRRLAKAPGAEGATLNLGSPGPEISIGELAAVILKVTGKNLRIIPLPATPGSPLRRCPDMTRTTALSGYQAQVSLEEGVRRTYAWYRGHIFSGREPSAL
jgi:UDP-glucose 4-epimerase